MKISELVEHLCKLQDSKGDIDVEIGVGNLEGLFPVVRVKHIKSKNISVARIEVMQPIGVPPNGSERAWILKDSPVATTLAYKLSRKSVFGINIQKQDPLDTFEVVQELLYVLNSPEFTERLELTPANPADFSLPYSQRESLARKKTAILMQQYKEEIQKK